MGEDGRGGVVYLDFAFDVLKDADKDVGFTWGEEGGASFFCHFGSW